MAKRPKSDCHEAKTYTTEEALEILDLKEIPIEDLLPLLPEDEKVENIKNRLSKSLNQYLKKVIDLKEELEGHAIGAEELRGKNNLQKHDHITVSIKKLCDLCLKPILDKQFYAFGCDHIFHRTCVQNKLMRHGPAESEFRTSFKAINDIKAGVILNKARPEAGSAGSVTPQTLFAKHDITSQTGGFIANPNNVVDQK